MADSEGSKYQWVTPKEHALQCPDMYIGSTAITELQEFVFQATGSSEAGGDVPPPDQQPTLSLACVSSTIETSPAIFQLLLEVLTNAVDNHRRDVTQTKIAIDVDAASGVFRVFNNGRTVPVEYWPGTTRYRPEILFGELLSSQNYDAAEREYAAGRNGVGVKIVALFAEWFEVELCDLPSGKRYSQRFEQNLTVIHPPRITKTRVADKKSSTCLRWKPDYARLQMSLPLDARLLEHIRMRAYDAAACTHPRVSIQYCGSSLAIRTTKDYARLMGGTWIGAEEVKHGGVTLLEVCVLQPDTLSAARVVGFVNGVRCSTGTHVDCVLAGLAEALSLRMKTQVRSAQLRTMLTIVINTVVPNSKYTGQTKTKLAVNKADLGYDYQPCSPAFLRNLEACCRPVLERESQIKDERSAQRAVGGSKVQVSAIPKYERATCLGSKRSCVLYVTEGDSAKALAVAGFAVIGRKYNGVFPLQGKPLNVRGKTAKMVLENKEIKHLIQILGLKFHTDYTDTLVDALPYAHIMIMTDQDHDGSHILGLLTNLFDTHFASLLQTRPTFLKRFATPIIKARIGNELQAFFSIPAYRAWSDARPVAWVKYYKGLGTSSRKEAIEYFKNLEQHIVTMRYDPVTTPLYMELFYGKHTDRRKHILEEGPTAPLDYSQPEVQIADFCTSELVEHGCAHNQRSMASVMDGLKPSNRKVLDVCLGRNREELKVASLAAITTEKNAYHHGEASLVGTIMKMAQWWVGTNNVALFEPLGQFGSRSNARSVGLAAPRYVTTRACQITRTLYPNADNPVLTYVEDDGKTVEPVYMVPIVAMVLVNGTDGIGVGYRSYVPNYHLLDVIQATRALIRGDANREGSHLQAPNFTGFKGTIAPRPPGQTTTFRCTGVYAVEGPNVRVTELPPHTWITDYKEWVEQHLVGNDAKKFVSEVIICGTDIEIDILLKCNANADLAARDLGEELHLHETISLNLMYLFDAAGKLRHYATPFEILDTHAAERRALYRRRLDHEISECERHIVVATNKARFIEAIRTRSLCVETHTRAQLEEWLHTGGYDHVGLSPHHFDYLIQNIGISTITNDGHGALLQQVARYQAELDLLRATTPDARWTLELDSLEKEYAAYLQTVCSTKAADETADASGQKRTLKKRPTAAPKRVKE